MYKRQPLQGVDRVGDRLLWAVFEELLSLLVVYTSLYYSRDAHVLRNFYESWCPATNTLQTSSGELSITLWDLHRLSGLSINNKIYYMTIPSAYVFNHHDKQNQRVILSSCDFLIVVFRCLEKAHSCEVNFWCKKKVIHDPSSHPCRRDTTHEDTQP